MRYTLGFYLFLASGTLALGQTPLALGQPNDAPAPDAGVASEWDARKMIDALNLQAQHLKPIVDQIQPADWVSQGASATYIAQWNTAQAQLSYLISTSDAFSRQPDRLALGLEAYFRMQSVESTLGSLTEGVRKYQNPALASLMQSVIAENSTNRDRLRQYLQDLATQKEQEFQVADREAQRCRAALLRQPAPKTKKVSQP
ncbi:MAG: hypothetical protein ABSE57_13430 [Bryobacteraceae bacterium]|jgi:uncharacterized membrane protein